MLSRHFLVSAFLTVLVSLVAQAQNLNLTNEAIAGLHEAEAARNGKPFKISARFTTTPSGSQFVSSLAIFPPNQGIWPLMPCTAVHQVRGARIEMRVNCADMLAAEQDCARRARAEGRTIVPMEWSPVNFNFTIEMKSLAREVGQRSEAKVRFSLVSQDVVLNKNQTSQFQAERRSSERFRVAQALGCRVTSL